MAEYGLIPDRGGKFLWLATASPNILANRGARIFKVENGMATTELAPYRWPQDSQDSSISAFFHDTRGRLWVGTMNRGGYYWTAAQGWRQLEANGAATWGIATPATVQFPSLLPLLRGEKRQLFDSVYCAYRGYQRMVRTDQYKLIFYPEAKRYQLFDIGKDPWETTSLDASQHAAIISELFRHFKRWQEQVGDTLEVEPKTYGISA